MAFFRFRSRIRNSLYHYRVTNWPLLRSYQHELAGTDKLPWIDLLACSWQHGATFENYFIFRFFEKTAEQRREYLTGSLRHELTRQVNDPSSTHLLRNKQDFARHFARHLGRKVFTYEEIAAEPTIPLPQELVIKPKTGQAGQGIRFVRGFSCAGDLLEHLKEDVNPMDCIFEERIVQHPDLDRLNPGSVNTLRIITFLRTDNDVELWGTYLRVGIDARVDNFSQGGLAMRVNDDGVVVTPAYFKDPSRPPQRFHPATNQDIVGFRVPHFAEAIALAKDAARVLPAVRSIGWDVAVLGNGVALIEGNDNWNVDVFQIPMGRGLRQTVSHAADLTLVYA